MPGLEDIVPQVIVEGIDEAISQFEKLGAAGAQAFAEILESAAHGDFTGLITHMFGETAGAITKATEAVTEFVASQAEAAEVLSNLGQATGMTIGELEGVRDAFASVGMQTSSFERVMSRMAMTISRDWTAIQQAVRTSADQQESAMLNQEGAALHTQEAYQRLSDAIENVSVNARKDAIGLQEAALGYERAVQSMSDAASMTQRNANSVESAQIALQRAQLNVQKDQGFDTSAAEKALKIQSDQLAVKEAQARVEEAQRKQAEEGLEMRSKQLAVQKAEMEVEAAKRKEIEDQIKGINAIKEAELGVQKAKLAQREAAEKLHEMDLRDLPAITRQISEVAEGTRTWSDVMNHAEISAQNLAKAVVLAASGGSGNQPKTKDVLMELATVFKQMGDEGDAAAKKLEILRALGATARMGGQTEAQTAAVLSRGPEFLKQMNEEAEKFKKTGIGFSENDVKTLDKFNETWTELDSIITQVKGHLAAVMAPAFIEFLRDIKNAIEDDSSSLHKFVDGVSTVIEFIANIGAEIGRLIGWIEKLKGMPSLFSIMFPGLSAALDAMKSANKMMESQLGTNAPEHPTNTGAAQPGRRTMSVLDPEFQQSGQAGQKLDQAADKQSAAADKQDQATSTWAGLGAMLMQILATAAKGIANNGAGMADGGLVSGPGGPTSDTAGMFPLSNGEYVVRAAAVQHYGADLFEAMNSLAIRGFASGGIVGARVASVPAGAGQGPSSILNLTIDGQHFNGLRAPENVASKLKSYAVTRLSSQAGPSPSWRR